MTSFIDCYANLVVSQKSKELCNLMYNHVYIPIYSFCGKKKCKNSKYSYQRHALFEGKSFLNFL